MSQMERDETREDRIHMEIVVDAYGPEEQAMGWYYYLDEMLSCPFSARCSSKRTISPLNEGDQATIISIAPANECKHEMFVMIEWNKGSLGVPLVQLEPIDTDEQTQEAVEDWHYWMQRGYQFG